MLTPTNATLLHRATIGLRISAFAFKCVGGAAFFVFMLKFVGL